jgi:hypothetical protein
MSTVTLFRPLGSAKLRLIEETGFRAFPPGLPEQPNFYPVCNERYAREIAERWNARGDELVRMEYWPSRSPAASRRQDGPWPSCSRPELGGSATSMIILPALVRLRSWQRAPVALLAQIA